MLKEDVAKTPASRERRSEERQLVSSPRKKNVILPLSVQKRFRTDRDVRSWGRTHCQVCEEVTRLKRSAPGRHHIVVE